MAKVERKVRRADAAEHKVARKVARGRDHALLKTAGQAAEIGDQPPLVALNLATIAAGALLGRPRIVRTGIRMLAAHGLATGIKAAIKFRLDRTRPHSRLEGKADRLGKGQHDTHDYNSFPSGHTAGAVAVAAAIVHEHRGMAGGAYGTAAAIAGVQVPRGAHYFSDVVAGALIGWAAAKTTNAALDPLFERIEALFAKAETPPERGRANQVASAAFRSSTKSVRSHGK